MKEEFIKREDAIEIAQFLVEEMGESDFDLLKMWAKERVDNIPSADVVERSEIEAIKRKAFIDGMDRQAKIMRDVYGERKRGEWEIIPTETFSRRKCTDCDYEEVLIDGFVRNFCPNCGADMRERKEP